jgi:acyl phosphate:glycerol-3-phosphate acyltransferase
MKFIVLPLIAYLLGSIPWGLVLTRCFAGFDIREQGSGNIGATNVRRLAGNRLGGLTLAGDVLKGWLPVVLAVLVAGGTGWWGAVYVGLVALCAFAGHLWPVYLGFRDGGKGVATAAGCFLAISPLAVAIALGGFVLVVWLSRRVSVGSLAAAAILPPAVGGLTGSLVPALAAGAVAVMIFARHTDNLRRLAKGTEPTIHF